MQLKYRFTFIHVESGTVSEILDLGFFAWFLGAWIEESFSILHAPQLDVKLYKPSIIPESRNNHVNRLNSLISNVSYVESRALHPLRLPIGPKVVPFWDSLIEF